MRYLPALLMLLLSSVSFAQTLCDSRYNYIWLFGGTEFDTITTDKFGGSEIDFNFSPPQINSHPKSVGMLTQTTSMCNRHGQLAFYSNGCSIINNIDSLMEEGAELSPGEISEFNCPFDGTIGVQNMISIPDSYNDSIFYIIYMSLQFNPNIHSVNTIVSENVYYSKINILENEGKGRVTEKNQIIFSDTNLITTPLTAVKHANGKDWWLITPNRWDNGFHSIRLDASGFHYVGLQSIGDTPHYWAEGGQGKFSPNGDKFAWYHPRNGLFLYDFNRANGTLSNFMNIHIPHSDFNAGGCEFSPKGQYVYVCNDSSLYQPDLKENVIQESLVLIANYDGFIDDFPTRFFLMERAPNNKILMNAVNGTQYLHEINDPDKKGAGCNFTQHSLKLPTYNKFTLPHFPNYKLGPIGDEPCDSLNVGIEEIAQIFDIKIVPNPALNKILICSDSIRIDPDWNYTIYNLDGKLVARSYQAEIDISSLSSGLYLIRILGINSPTRPLIFIKN